MRRRICRNQDSEPREAKIDRQTVYYGQVPLETDLLHAQQNALVALAKLSAAVLGSGPIVNGFTCTPTAPASLNVLLTAGEIYQLENLEATAWSSLPAITANSILKQGIQLGNVQFGITPPGTGGFSQVFLIEVQYQDLDSGSTTLPYFNSASPTVPFFGPGNSGTAQNTVRQGVVASQVKAGVAATTGTQVAPTADAGWVGLFTVTVANGASTITSGNIATVPGAPFITSTLTNVPASVQAHSWEYAADTGTASALSIAPAPAPAAYAAGMGFYVKAANAPTGASTLNVLGSAGTLLGTISIVNPDGSAIVSNQWLAGAILGLFNDGTHFQLLSISRYPPTQQVNFYSGSQTITIPAGFTKALVKMWGATGGSGGVNSGDSAGTGAGGYLEKFLTGLTPGNTLVYTQGAAGTAGASTPTAGGNAGTTTLASGSQTISTLTCNGSIGTVIGTTSATAGSTGGAASGGDINISGQSGQATSGAGASGAGGCTFYSRGADGVGAAGNLAGNAGNPGGLQITWMT